MTDISYSGRVVNIGSEEVTVCHPVEDALCQDGAILVLFEHPQGETNDRNVIAFDEQANQLWEIESARQGSGDPNPFMDLRVEGGSVIGDTWKRIEYEIDLDTGAIEAKRFNR